MFQMPTIAGAVTHSCLCVATEFFFQKHHFNFLKMSRNLCTFQGLH